MIGAARFHRWCDSYRLVNPREVTVHVVKRNRRFVILKPLRERIRQPCEPAAF